MTIHPSLLRPIQSALVQNWPRSNLPLLAGGVPMENLLFLTDENMVDSIGLSVKRYIQPQPPSPTKYVSTETGNDGNDGSENLPWKTVPYAVQMLSAGDTLGIMAPSTLPGRGRIVTTTDGTLSDPITLTGIDGKACLTNSLDISHGANVGNLIENGDCEAWLSDTSLYGVTSTGDALAKEPTIKHSGTYSIKAKKTASNIIITNYVRNLPADTEYDFSFWYRDDNTTGYVTFQVMERASTRRYLQADGSWATTSYTFVLANSGGEWAQASVRFRSGVYQYYEFAIKNGYVATKYFDDISLTPVIDQYTWEQHSGDVYKISTGLAPVTVAGVCSNTDWLDQGMDALVFRKIASSLVTCESTPGSFYYAGSGFLYYHLAAGEAIGSLHIEAETTKIASENKFINLNHDYYKLYDIKSFLGRDANIITEVGKSVDFYRVDSWGARLCGFQLRGNHYLHGCDSKYTNDEDCYQVSDGVSLLFNCTGSHAWDDNFQAVSVGEMHCYFCIGTYAGAQGASDSSNFVSEGVGVNMYLKNCVSYGSAGRGISVGDAINVSVKNCASLNNADGDFHHSSLNQTSFIHTKNIGATKNTVWTLDATESLADPLFVDPDNGDFRLQPNSPCVGAGSVPFVNGDGDQYDAAGNIIWNDTYDLPDGHWIDGVDIGAYAYGGANKVFPKLSNPSEGVWIWESAPDLLDITGVNNAVYNADGTGKEFATQALAFAAFASLANDTQIFAGDTQIAIYSTDQSANATKINQRLK